MVTNPSFSHLETQYSNLIELHKSPSLIVDENGVLCFVEQSNYCVRFFYKYAFGYSFDSASITRALNSGLNTSLSTLQKIERFSNKQTKIDFLRNTLRVSIIAYRELASIYKREKQSKLSCYNEDTITVNSNVMRLITDLANLEDKSIMTVLLEFDLLDLAYSRLIEAENKYEELNAVPLSYLGKLLQPCCDAENVEAILVLSRLGVDVIRLCHEKYTFKTIVNVALDCHDEESIVSLLIHATSNQIHEFSDIPLLFKCAHKGFLRAVRFLIENEATLGLSDQKGVQLLYYSLSSLHYPLIQYVLSKVDPAQVDSNGKTAFTLFFASPAQSRQKRDIVSKILLQEDNPLLFLSRDTAVKSVQIGDLRVSHLMLVYLFGKEISTGVYASRVSREQFDDECLRIKKSFPNADVLAFISNHYVFLNKHYRFNYEVVSPREGSTRIEPTRLISLFSEAIHASGTMLSKQGGVYSSIDSRRFIEMRRSLTIFVNNIHLRNALQGAPKKGTTAFKEFYDEIDMLLSDIIRALERKKDYITTINTIDEFSQAAERCAGRYYSVVVDQHLALCKGVFPTPLSKLMDVIAEFRLMLFQNAVIEATGTREVHNHNHAIRFFGKKYGIPGYKSLQRFDDMYIGHNYDTAAIEREFLKLYTPQAVVKNWLLPIFTREGLIREQYIDWHKKYIPSEWRREKYSVIRDHVSLLNQTLADEKQKKIKAYLLTQDICMSLSETWDEAIEHDRVMSYLAEFVYNDDQISYEGVLYFLEKTGVIQSFFRYKDKAKELTHIIPDNDTFFDWVIDMIQHLSSAIRKLIHQYLLQLQHI